MCFTNYFFSLLYISYYCILVLYHYTIYKLQVTQGDKKNPQSNNTIESNLLLLTLVLACKVLQINFFNLFLRTPRRQFCIQHDEVCCQYERQRHDKTGSVQKGCISETLAYIGKSSLRIGGCCGYVLDLVYWYCLLTVIVCDVSRNGGYYQGYNPACHVEHEENFWNDSEIAYYWISNNPVFNSLLWLCSCFQISPVIRISRCKQIWLLLIIFFIIIHVVNYVLDVHVQCISFKYFL